MGWHHQDQREKERRGEGVEPGEKAEDKEEGGGGEDGGGGEREGEEEEDEEEVVVVARPRCTKRDKGGGHMRMW